MRYERTSTESLIHRFSALAEQNRLRNTTQKDPGSQQQSLFTSISKCMQKVKDITGSLGQIKLRERHER